MSTQQLTHARRANGKYNLKRGEDFVRQLAYLWNEQKMTSGQCGAEMGVTRNVIIGVVHRHNDKKVQLYGIKFEMRGNDHSFRSRNRSRTSVNGRGIVQRVKKRKQRLEAEALAPAALHQFKLSVLYVPISQRVYIDQLTELTCRWPIGDSDMMNQFYCGGLPRGGGPYCAGHHALAFRGLGKPVKRTGPQHPFWR